MLAPMRLVAARRGVAGAAKALVAKPGGATTTTTAVRRMGGAGHAPAPPPFQPLPGPTGPVHEEFDLLWHDGVAPEMCIDFDAPEIPRLEGLAWWVSGLGFFATLGMFIGLVWDPAARKRTVTRKLELGDALPYEASGGKEKA